MTEPRLSLGHMSYSREDWRKWYADAEVKQPVPVDMQKSIRCGLNFWWKKDQMRVGAVHSVADLKRIHIAARAS